jgi:glycogen operon protein
VAPDSPAKRWSIKDRGRAPALGATLEKSGAAFAVCSDRAERIELCFFDPQQNEVAKLELPGRDGDVFHGFVPSCPAGQSYGYRVHGPYQPGQGLRFNPAKLLLDPYAREISHDNIHSDTMLAYADGNPDADEAISHTDSGPFAPKSIVTAAATPSASLAARRVWAETVIYEANVRGLTMQHPDLTESERGTFRGLCNGQILRHLRALGITAIELLPVHAFFDEAFLTARGLRNFWGYNSIGFFAPHPRYATARDSGFSASTEFQLMVDALHDHSIEVILDVVYNHTAEGNRFGPTLSFRGIDNLGYYRVAADAPGRYINDTGCGNTLNADSPMVQKLVIDSLSYWAGDLGVDGFRFDLAPILGRRGDGFQADHPLLQGIVNAPALAGRRLIAEPWDVGPGGYQLGRFPAPFAEWNDKYRDAARKFWCGDGGQSAEFARRLHGSADIFEATGRGPSASINFITSHDGFTLRDLVSYETRHNEANGEENRDGHKHNYSRNHGVEGETDDPAILAVRRRQRLNLLATLLLSQGTPMLLAGDELGNGQLGNNNAYAQDNPLGWVDWSGLEDDPAFITSVAQLIELRQRIPLLRQPFYVHGETRNRDEQRNIEWLGPGGQFLDDGEWSRLRSLTLMLVDPSPPNEISVDAVAVLMNADEAASNFRLPVATGRRSWRCVFSTSEREPVSGRGPWQIEPYSIAVFRRSRVFRT